TLALTKTADAATVLAGSAIGYTLTASNPGQNAAASVSLVDALPTGTGVVWTMNPSVPGCSINSGALSCDLGTLTAGGSVTVHVTSPTTASSCAGYSNTATLSAMNAPAVQASAATTVQCTTLALTKTADAATVLGGASIGYTLSANNAGGNTAASV